MTGPYPRAQCHTCGRNVQLRVRDLHGNRRLEFPVLARHSRMARGGGECPASGTRPRTAPGPG